MSNYEASSERSADSKRKKRRKIDGHNRFDDLTNCRTKWRTDSERQIYSVKFLEALRRTSGNPNSPAISNSTGRGRIVRETADRILASSARGRTRWSRAILSNRLSLKLINKRHKKVKAPAEIKPKKTDAKRRLPLPPLPPLRRKAQILGKLVPGCHNLSLPNLLEETTDYIAALEMQVRALSTLAGILTAAGTPTDFSNHP